MIAGQLYRKLDWPLIITWFALVMIGWISVFASVYDEEHAHILDISQRYGMQFIWIITSLIIASFILFVINPKLYNVLAWILYFMSMLLLFAVIFVGVEVNGSKSWFMIGPVRVQPAELAKITTSFALASMMSAYNFRLKRFSSLVKVGLVIVVPMLLIILEKETGSALVFASFLFVLYREGLSGWYLTFGILAILLFVVTLAFSSFTSMILLFVLMVVAKTAFSKRYLHNIVFLAAYLPVLILSPRVGELKFIPWALKDVEWLAVFMTVPLLYFMYKAIREKTRYMKYILLSFFVSTALIFSVQFFFDEVLQDHQRARIENLLGVTEDLQGAGYNVHQSKIAIGSGGFFGKGFLKGTQTKFNFVPEQSTDFIFCTVGEEWGFAGSLVVVGLFVFMLIRILTLAERQKDNFTRIYGYALASVIFMHFFINIGMTIGIMPVIGIPLPFVSYGGSSLWAFTIFLFVFIRLDLERWK
ncbi:MAG: rod shape-determining protein RodA [Bacteroidetes bacterium HGW-Bacteroidetes-14]|jgi:rod shape determining protein RodA|nr:MAG: rod shape-determining protein RodA [Bacteroidetes bacterium HGW-Bacteroidetes-14]